MTAEVPEIFKWLEQSPLGANVRESLWLFPAIETLHLLAMSLLLSTIGALDLRLMGLALKRIRVSELSKRIFPWAWSAFAIQIVTGLLLFCSEATRMAVNPAFRTKLALIGLAGLHAAVFRWIACRDMPEWDVERSTPVRAKIAGIVSILLWVGVVAAGRWIGFV